LIQQILKLRAPRFVSSGVRIRQVLAILSTFNCCAVIPLAAL